MERNTLDDDENVKDMRATARQVGLTKILLDLRRSLDALNDENASARLRAALDLLGASNEEGA